MLYVYRKVFHARRVCFASRSSKRLEPYQQSGRSSAAGILEAAAEQVEIRILLTASGQSLGLCLPIRVLHK